MVELEGGNIVFGTDSPHFPDEPALETRYVETFSMEATEVTNARYGACVQAGVCKEPKDTTYYDQRPLYDNHPVVYVTLDQALTYCAWLGRRLPDTYEWERAARGLADQARLWPWGNSPPSKDKANIITPPENEEGWNVPEGTQPVRSFTEGAAREGDGIFDLVGNEWEWTSTQLGEGIYVQRGGSWNATMEGITKVKIVDIRKQVSPDQAVGFRCAQSNSK
jgi:formylglycine-generating enzyme required for sulfatase activity